MSRSDLSTMPSAGAKPRSRRGCGPFDFRPGLPLHLFMSVLVKPAELNEDNKFVGQVEQMYASRCFKESKGKLGCIYVTIRGTSSPKPE